MGQGVGIVTGTHEKSVTIFVIELSPSLRMMDA
jgi:hypothetical protein